MKTVKNRLNVILASLLLITIVTSCETTDLEQLNDPSREVPESADPSLLLNNAALFFANAYAFNEGNEDGLNVRASETMRMQHLFGPYAGPFSLTSGNINRNIWQSFYRETLKDIETLLPVAEERGILGTAGVAKILKAYTYVTLVDTWGDVPFSEALNATDFPSPRVDSGQDIYNAMLVLLDEAIANISTPESIMPNDDLFYGGDRAKWLTLARTLKFKMYLQMRLIGDFSSEINALLAQGIIDDPSEDFQFSYSRY
ncbi:SusD/RagB family nutrient-binding outer membrane lipoprotein [Aquimarina sp. 2304DJ70-9]|uniref:SusD/RagB family nutrient-binding outer membrane lipoprotein n=1 Tax=Aquimarina penaris TaxID=3231044 RepID=UPI003462DF47